MKKAILFFFLFIVVATAARATHIRAGEIIAERISQRDLTFRFTLIGYIDTEGQTPYIEFGSSGTFDYGDGRIDTLKPAMFDKTVLEEGIAKYVYVSEHTFQAPGTYTVGYMEFNRNDDILNINEGYSDNTPFYVETVLVINPILGLNNTPVLLTPPLDKAVSGVKYVHNPGAYDVDGDSLSYKIVVNKESKDKEVNQYTYPNDPLHYQGMEYVNSSGGPPSYSIDPVDGTLVWDAPGMCGEYNVAFIVEDWRKIEGQWIKLGYVTRDMQVIVECVENTPPEIEVPQDTCIVAGSLLETEILVTDEELHNVELEAYGGLFEMSGNTPQFFPDPVVEQTTTPNPAKGQFVWQTECYQVREQPYTVYFRAVDKPTDAPQLTSYESWNITIVGPAPTGLTAEVKPGKKIDLQWDDYSCPQAESMEIWRKVDRFEFEASNCQIGIPPNAGYELVGTVPISQTTYTDTKGLDSGPNYCYRLVAAFSENTGGESYASEEACAIMESEAPVITHVDVLETDETNGRIQVSWRSPLKIDATLFPEPYTYEVLREDPESGETISLGRTQDTTWTDEGLKTHLYPYSYQIKLYDGADEEVAVSATASSVFLTLKPGLGKMRLQWEAEVPWSLITDEYPWHYIYRDRVDAQQMESLVLIDSVQSTAKGLRFTDDGSYGELSDEEVYCYKVLTQGSYGNSDIVAPLLNTSQRACAQPNDTVPPCSPLEFSVSNLESSDCEAFIESKPCDLSQVSNTLNWEAQLGDECDNDIEAYKVLFSPAGSEGVFDTVATVKETYFEHRGLESFAGCYKVVAVDRSGNVSEATEAICIENCTYYELPNVFTPNGDNLNDTFRPFSCPLFVESVKFRVYNRWGKQVYTFKSGGENSIYIQWDGRANNKKLLPSGIYYYEAEVKFKTLDPAKSKQFFKGWVDVKY